MSEWIVIEGDNGTGKDSLAAGMRGEIISYRQEAKELERAAKQKNGIERVRTFLKYNEKCAEWAQVAGSSIVIRYWPSTVAGAYADLIINEAEMDEYIQRCRELPKPDLLIILRCEESERIQRILKRNQESPVPLQDDIRFSRSERHRYALGKIRDCFSRVLEIDNTYTNSREILGSLRQLTL